MKKNFHSEVFFEKWNDTEKPKKKSEIRELSKDKWCNQMGQVGTSWSRGTSGIRRKGSSDLSGTNGTRRRGSSDLRGTSGGKDKGSVHLNHSTCPKWECKPGRGLFNHWRIDTRGRHDASIESAGS